MLKRRGKLAEIDGRRQRKRAMPMHQASAAKGAMYRFLECTVDQYMTRDVMTVKRDVTLRELEELFERHDFNAFPVWEDGAMLGLVTKFDFLRAFAFTTDQLVPHYDELMQRRVGEMMSRRVMHVEATAPLTRALQMMVDIRARSLPVVDSGGKLAGIISREDVMRALRDATERS
jgi:CBS-domain-containing membrane protein